MTDNGSRTIPITTPDPGVEGVRAGVERYVRLYPDLIEPIRMYGAIMEVQQEALGEVGCGIEIERRVVDDRMMLGEPLLDPLKVEIDKGKYLDLVEKVCDAVNGGTPGGLPACGSLLSWSGLAGEDLAGTREKVLKGEALELEGEWADRSDVVSRILWESMFPFFRSCGSALEKEIDHALWQKGYCPICGAPPLIGKFRPEDGLWLLECSLCHTWWNVQRAWCPFCTEGAQGSLEFLFLEDDRSRRVQYCSACRQYVKTMDLREGDEGVLMPLEDIATALLDRAAAERGLKPPPGRL